MNGEFMIGAGLLILLLALGGLGGLGLAVCFSARRLSSFDKSVLAVLWGPLFISVLALALADAGRFGLAGLLAGSAVWGGAGLAGMAWDFRRRKEQPEEEDETKHAPFLLGLGVVLVAAGLLVAPAHRYLMGGWDPGEYVCTAANVARTGDLAIQDPILAGLSTSEQRVLMHEPEPPRRTLQAGYLVINEAQGRLLPDYYHLYPAWLAVWVRLFGLGGAWVGHTTIALFALGLVMVAAARLFGMRTALLAGAALVLCAAQAYLMRFTTAEMMTQFCLFAGFWALDGAMRRAGGAGLAMTAGVAFGAAVLAHGTALLPAAGVLIFLGLRAFSRREWDAWLVLGLVCSGVAGALVWNGLRAGIVTRFLWEYVALHPGRWALAAALGVTVLAGALIWGRRVTGRARGGAGSFAMRWLPAALVVALAIYGTVFRPWDKTDPDALNVIVFARLIAPAGFALAIGFFILRPWKDWSDGQKAFLLAGGMSAGVLLAHKMVQPLYLWAARRWVPMAAPFALILAAETVMALLFLRHGGAAWKDKAWQAARYVLAILAMVFWFGGMAKVSAPVFRVHEYAGLPGLMSELAESVKDADRVLCGHWEPATPLRYAFGVPAWQVSRLSRPGGLKDGRVAAGLLRRWVRQGKRVYWIGELFFDPGIRLTEVASPSGAFVALERRKDRLPRAAIPEKRRFTVYRVDPATDAPWAEPIMVGTGYSAMGLINGFMEWERARVRDGTSFGFRRTKGLGRLYMPALSGNWRIRLNGYAADRTLSPVVLRADGQKIAEIEVTSDWAWHAFTLPAGLGTNGVVTLEIESPHISKGKAKVGVGVAGLRYEAVGSGLR